MGLLDTRYLGRDTDERKRGMGQFTPQQVLPEQENSFFGGNSVYSALGGITLGSDGSFNLPGKLPGSDTTKGSGFGWNMDTMNMIGKGLGGLGNLASGWAALKGLGIAEEELEENKRQYNQNYAQQLRAFEGDRTRANTRISDQNAWKTAQGRTDLGSLIL